MLKLPSVAAWWLSAPSRQVSLAISWSSHTAIMGRRRAGLQVGVALVLGVALAVVGQAEDFLGGRGQAAQCPGVGRCVAALAVFVDVVAQVHGGVRSPRLAAWAYTLPK